jgi:hypothetical protein
MTARPVARLRRSRGRRPQIGLHVSSHDVSAVAVQLGRMVWSARESQVDSDVERAVRLVLGRIPAFIREQRPDAVLSVGPAASQLRRLEGLPATESPELLKAAVASSSSRFFVSVEEALATGAVVSLESGQWVASMDRDVLGAVQHACIVMGMRLKAAVPLAALLAQQGGAGTFAWREADLAWLGERREGRLHSLRRVPASHPDALKLVGIARPAASDTTEGDDGPSAALWAASASLPLAFDCLGGSAASRSIRAPMLVLAAALLCAVLAPFVIAKSDTARNREELRMLEDSLRRTRAHGERAERATALARLSSSFSAEQRSVLVLLAGLGDALSDATALTSLRVDSAAVTISMLTPQTASALDEIQQVPGLGELTIVGSLAPEQIDEMRYERLTVRAVFADSLQSRNSRERP